MRLRYTGTLKWPDIKYLIDLSDQHYDRLKNFGARIFEPTCAHCTVGSYASLSVCLSSLDQNSDLIVIHISKSIAPRVMKFGERTYVNDHKVILEGQGHRSKVKVRR